MIEKFNINEKVADEIEAMLLNPSFSWFYNDSTVSKLKKTRDTEINSPQLTHVFFGNNEVNSAFYPNVTNILSNFKLPFKLIQFYRIKANLNFNVNEGNTHMHQPIHVDTEKKGYKSFIYYVNESDGDTLFFDNNGEIINRISPKKGMGILFDSNIAHAAQNPIKSLKRLVINFVFRCD